MRPSPCNENANPTGCIIIGAGISGLIAANFLQNAGISVIVLDKGKAIGGRLATRRVRSTSIGEGTFDYGAQLFSASSSTFQKMADDWQRLGMITEWGTEICNSGRVCYRGIDSSRSIALFLARDIVVHSMSHVIRIEHASSSWQVQTEDGRVFKSRGLIITCPTPQALNLLRQSNINLPSDMYQRLEGVKYSRCLAGLVLLERESNIPDPGGVRLPGQSVAWLACNRKKGISKCNAITILATPEFSMLNWSEDDSKIVSLMVDSAKSFLGAAVMEAQIHRWRYSQPSTFYGEYYLALRDPGILIMAGDAFSPANGHDHTLNLERAVQSGLKAAHYYIRHRYDVSQ